MSSFKKQEEESKMSHLECEQCPSGSGDVSILLDRGYIVSQRVTLPKAMSPHPNPQNL